LQRIYYQPLPNGEHKKDLETMYALNNIHTIKSTHKTCVETNCIIKHNATGIGLYGIDEIS